MFVKQLIPVVLLSCAAFLGSCATPMDNGDGRQATIATYPPGGRPKQIVLKGMDTVIVVVTVQQDAKTKKEFKSMTTTPHSMRNSKSRLILVGPQPDTLSDKNCVSEDLELEAKHVTALQDGLDYSETHGYAERDVQLEFKPEDLLNKQLTAAYGTTSVYDATFVGWYTSGGKYFLSVESMSKLAVTLEAQ